MLKRVLSAILVFAIALGLLLPLSVTAAAAYNWTYSSGPGDGDAWGLAYDAARDILYRSCNGRGVWRYKAGAWERVGTLGGQRWSLAYDSTNNVLYCGGGFSVWRCANPDTVDSSYTWTNTCPSGGIAGLSARALTYVGGGNDVLLAGTSTSGVWVCTNPRTSPSWSKLTGGPDSNQIYGFAMDMANSRVYVAGEGRVWRYDYLPTPGWHYIGNGTPYNEVDSIAFDPTRNKLYAGFNNCTGVYRCDNPENDTTYAWTSIGGATGEVRRSNVQSLGYDEARNMLYAGCQAGLYTGTPGVWSLGNPDGAGPFTWTNTNGGVSVADPYEMIYVPSNNRLYAGAMVGPTHLGYGAWMCTTPDATPAWTDLTGGPSDLSVHGYSYDAARDLLYAATDSGIWKCENPSTAPTWTSLGLTGDFFYAVAYDDTRNILYAGRGYYGGGVFRCTSPDTSPSWAATPSVGPSNEGIAALVCDTANDRVYAGGCPRGSGHDGRGVWRGDDASGDSGGTTWTGIGLGGDPVWTLVYDPAHGLVYAGTQGDGAWRISDPAGTPALTDIRGAAPNYHYCFAYDPTRNLLYSATNLGVWRCENPQSDAPWTSTGGGVSGYNMNGLAYDATRNDLHAGTQGTSGVGNGVWRCTSPNGAPTWTDTGGQLAGQEVPALVNVPGDVVFAGVGDFDSKDRTGAGAFYATVTGANTPTVATNSATSVTSSGATLRGNITSTGGEGCDSRGFQYREQGSGSWSPYTEDDGPYGTGAFSHPVKALDPETTYEYRAWAHNSAGTATGSTRTFTTGSAPPPAQSTWYLAEGTTAWGFSCYVSIVNPGDRAVTVDLTYMPTGEANQV